MLLEVFEAETGTASSVDFDGADVPSAFGLLQGGRVETGAGGGAAAGACGGVGAPLAGHELDHAALDADHENCACKNQPYCNTHLVFLKFKMQTGRGLAVVPSAHFPNA